jgi:hypothetical protein
MTRKAKLMILERMVAFSASGDEHVQHEQDMKIKALRMSALAILAWASFLAFVV